MLFEVITASGRRRREPSKLFRFCWNTVYQSDHFQFLFSLSLSLSLSRSTTNFTLNTRIYDFKFGRPAVFQISNYVITDDNTKYTNDEKRNMFRLF